ncbi:MAG: pyridoxal-phosphate dependent enzyme [Candidatus Nomurabacteria bacterium]|nr:pyridoxal-phosphate dependent enzyme [Candidatus Nomurabacteria bacterium]
MKNNKKIYEGESAVRSFLLPSNFGLTSIVELPSSLNPFKKDKVRIFVKLVHSAPLGNIKSLPSYVMLNNIPEKKRSRIKNLIEYSSGNTALSLTILAQYFGIPNVHAIITPDVPEHKKRLLQLVGTNLLISHGPPCPDVFGKVGGVHEAKMFGKKAGWYNLNQYINPGNMESSKEYVGKELWYQFGEKLSVFISSMGTAGTISGAGQYLKKKKPSIKVIGTAIKKGSEIPGPRDEIAIHKLGIAWQKIVDEVVPIDARAAFEKSLALIRLGLFVGPSTGMQLAAILSKLKEYKKKNKLKELKNADGEIVCCFLACDSMAPYVDEYFENLPKSFFPKVKDL